LGFNGGVGLYTPYLPKNILLKNLFTQLYYTDYLLNKYYYYYKNLLIMYNINIYLSKLICLFLHIQIWQADLNNKLYKEYRIYFLIWEIDILYPIK